MSRSMQKPNNKDGSAGLQTATKTVAFATKNINLRVMFLLRSPLATIYIYML